MTRTGILLVLLALLAENGAMAQERVLFRSPGERFQQAAGRVEEGARGLGGAVADGGREVADAAKVVAVDVRSATQAAADVLVDKTRDAARAVAGAAAHAPDREWLVEGVRRAEEAARELRRPEPMWKASLAALAAASAVDAHSSWNKPEANGVLAGANGRFGARSVGVKVGLTGVAVAVQWWMVKRNVRTARYFAAVNAGLTVTHGVVAAHNYGNGVGGWASGRPSSVPAGY